MEIESLKTEDLVPYVRNARTHSGAQVAQIAASIDEFGMVGAIVVRDGVIAKGHGTLAAVRKLYAAGKRLYPPPGRAQGAEPFPDGTVPVLDASGWTDAQFRAFVIADNKLALNAEWDEAMLALELAELKDEDFDLALIGFDETELAKLTSSESNPGLTDPDDVPEPPEEPITNPGDIWQLGNHRLMCGDSTSTDAIERLMGGGMADMWLTDPPYNVAYEGKTKDSMKIKNDSMSDGDFRQFLRDCYTAADSFMKPGAVFYIWHADSEGYNFRGAAHDVGWRVRQCLIWRKNIMVMGRQDYHWRHEPCLYGWKDGAGHLWASDRKQTTILEFDRPQRNGEHPTMKPVTLFEYQMLNNTKGADVVLDSFGGSGTTLIAAEKNGRHARLMELDPKYCDVIIKRWEDFTGRKAVLTSER